MTPILEISKNASAFAEDGDATRPLITAVAPDPDPWISGCFISPPPEDLPEHDPGSYFNPDPLTSNYAIELFEYGTGPGWTFSKSCQGFKAKISPTEAAVQNGLRWLRDHQSPDGFWNCDEFMIQDQHAELPASDGAGNASNDVGVTGLALLAFLGNGHTMSKGKFSSQVRDGISWLRTHQDPSTGLFGKKISNATLYNHCLASFAMGEATYSSRQSPVLMRNLRNATRQILNSQNPYNAWGYSLEPDGRNNTSITGWAVFALLMAEDCKVLVPSAAFNGAREWFNTMTDKKTGRTGYAFGGGGGPGGLSSRQKEYIERYPPEKSEALTAVSLLCRIFMTDGKKVKTLKEHPSYELLKQQADLILNKPPVWNTSASSCDMYYWYYGTEAMRQWGGKHWKTWKKSMEKALLPNQRQGKGNFSGSWDPIGPWGKEGGRVYSTAICTLILESYYRYARVIGAR